MPQGFKPLNRDQVDRLLELPKLDQRSRQALMDHAKDPAGYDAHELRAALREDPVVATAIKNGARFMKAAARVPFLQLFPEATPEPKRQAPPVPVTFAGPARPPAFSADPSLDRLELVLDNLMSNPEQGAWLQLKLHRIGETLGFEKKVFTGVSVKLEPSDLPGADLGLEERTQQYAEEVGLFGKYQWSIKAFAGEAVILDTTRTVNVEAPPGYRPPQAVNPAAPTMPAPDPRAEARESLGLLKDLAGIVGLGGKQGGLTQADLEAARRDGRETGHATGKMEGLRESDREWETKLEARVKEAKDEAYKRGLVDGRREAEDGFREKERELERQAETGPPSMIQEVVATLGGAEVVQGLVAALASGALSGRKTAPVRPAAPPPEPGRPPMALAPRPAPGPGPMPLVPAAAPQPVPPPPAPPVAALPEPTRAEHAEALRTLDDCLELLEEGLERGPEAEAALRPIHTRLAAYRAEGVKEGPLGAWWEAWRLELEPNVVRIIQSLEAELDEAPIPGADNVPTIDDLKALLATRLNEHATPAAIVDELRHTVPAATLDEWRKLLGKVPASMALAFLDVPDQHTEAGQAVLDAFKAAS